MLCPCSFSILTTYTEQWWDFQICPEKIRFLVQYLFMMMMMMMMMTMTMTMTMTTTTTTTTMMMMMMMMTMTMMMGMIQHPIQNTVYPFNFLVTFLFSFVFLRFSKVVGTPEKLPH